MLKTKFEHSVSLLTWGYNEEDLVEEFLDRAIALMETAVEDFEIVFVDDGSTDRTSEIVQAYAKKEQRLRVISNEKNLNMGASCRLAIAAAKKEYLFWQMVDWFYDLKNLRIFLELLKHFDVVQGVRPTPERLLSHIPLIKSIYRVKTRSDNIKKAIVSLGNYYLLRILYGIDFHDFQNVTIYPTRRVQSLEIVGRSSFFNPELLFKTYREGARFIEVPIKSIPRQAGEAKGSKLSSVLTAVVDIILNFLKWGWRLNIENRKRRTRQIFRIREPHLLEEEVIRLSAPLFKEFR